MKRHLRSLWPVLILVLFPPWSVLMPGSKVFLGHAWFWSPPLINSASYTVAVDHVIMLAEAAGIILLILLAKAVRGARL